MRYLPLTEADRREMLAAIGVQSIDDLFTDVPPAARHPGLLDLPRAMGELDVERRLGAMAAENVVAGLVRPDNDQDVVLPAAAVFMDTLHNGSHDVFQAGLVDRAASGHQADVAGHVEVGVVDPGRPGQAERSGSQALAQAGRGVQAGGHVRAQARQVERRPAGGRIEQQDLARVAGDPLRLQREDPRVLVAETLRRHRSGGGYWRGGSEWRTNVRRLVG